MGQARTISARGSITLGALRGRLSMAEVACRRCDRPGRLRLDRAPVDAARSRPPLAIYGPLMTQVFQVCKSP
jgi:hypothetical protein